MFNSDQAESSENFYENEEDDAADRSSSLSALRIKAREHSVALGSI